MPKNSNAPILQILYFREHWQETFIMLRGFWLLRGLGGAGGGSVNPLKNTIRDENLFYRWMKIYLKICEKWYILMWKLIVII